MNSTLITNLLIIGLILGIFFLVVSVYLYMEDKKVYPKRKNLKRIGIYKKIQIVLFWLLLAILVIAAIL